MLPDTLCPMPRRGVEQLALGLGTTPLPFAGGRGQEGGGAPGMLPLLWELPELARQICWGLLARGLYP